MKVCKNRFCLKEHPDYSYKFCKIEECGCTLIPCKNVNHCRSAFPAHFYKEENEFITNGTCNKCSLFDITFFNEKGKCIICSDLLYMVEMNCQPKMCLDCIINIDDKYDCPFFKKKSVQALSKTQLRFKPC